MKEKLDLIKDRIDNINNILGELDTEDPNNSVLRKDSEKKRFTNISDAVSYLQNQMTENDTIFFKEVYKKCKSKK